MNKQEALEWSAKQSVVRVRAFQENEEDRFTFTVGDFIVTPLVFDSYEEAEEYLNENFKLTNLDLAIIGAMCQKLNELNNQSIKNEEE